MRCCLLVLTFTLVWAGTSSAQQPLHALLGDMEDDRLDHFSLLEAAGVLGGMQPAEISAARMRLRGIVATVDRKRGSVGRTRVAALLDLLHDRVLTGQYDEDASQVSVALRSGDFNCASSTGLFLATIRMAGLHAKAVLLPGHVRCRVWCDDVQRWADVEPSLRSGVKGLSPDSHQNEREISDVQLLAKLMYNQAIDALRQQSFDQALVAARRSVRYDPRHQAARDNEIAIRNNWALSLCGEGKYETALLVLGRQPGRSLDASLEPSEIHVYVTWMRALLTDGDLMGVEMRLRDALARYPKSDLLQNLASQVQSVRNNSPQYPPNQQ